MITSIIITLLLLLLILLNNCTTTELSEKETKNLLHVRKIERKERKKQF